MDKQYIIFNYMTYDETIDRKDSEYHWNFHQSNKAEMEEIVSNFIYTGGRPGRKKTYSDYFIGSLYRALEREKDEQLNKINYSCLLSTNAIKLINTDWFFYLTKDIVKRFMNNFYLANENKMKKEI